VGAAMASYLTRNKSRFIFSHKSVWCPLKDIESLLEGGEANVYISQNRNVPFFQCAALHYLCQPEALEHLSAFEFYSEYEVVRMTSKNSHEMMKFSHSDSFKHPSYNDRKGTFLQGVRKREKPCLIKVFHYEFPDTAEFGGSLLDDNTYTNDAMERYSKLVLMLFYPYRDLYDLVETETYTELLQAALANDIIGESAITFLRNMQDTRSNSFRITGVEDDLQRNTQLMRNNDSNYHDRMHEDTEGEEQHNDLDQLLDLIDAEADNYDASDDCGDGSQSIPKSLSLKSIRNKGTERCGYNCLAGMNLSSVDCDGLFLEVEEQQNQLMEPQQSDDTDEYMHDESKPSQHDIVQVLLTKRRRRNRTFEEITNSNEVVNVLEANGSVKSIIDWAKKAQLDRKQRRAFEIIVSTFILTFYKDSGSNDELVRHDRHTFVSAKRQLQTLAEVSKRGSEQLILLLHGPGGSGKTTVIDLVMKYAEEYCNNLETMNRKSGRLFRQENFAYYQIND
jgi:hypothetical protein